jgi:hypothetical protein
MPELTEWQRHVIDVAYGRAPYRTTATISRYYATGPVITGEIA